MVKILGLWEGKSNKSSSTIRISLGGCHYYIYITFVGCRIVFLLTLCDVVLEGNSLEFQQIENAQPTPSDQNLQ